MIRVPWKYSRGGNGILALTVSPRRVRVSFPLGSIPVAATRKGEHSTAHELLGTLHVKLALGVETYSPRLL
jgi:hypothetical protein